MEVVVLVEVDEALQYARQKLGAMQKKAPHFNSHAPRGA